MALSTVVRRRQQFNVTLAPDVIRSLEALRIAAEKRTGTRVSRAAIVDRAVRFYHANHAAIRDQEEDLARESLRRVAQGRKVCSWRNLRVRTPSGRILEPGGRAHLAAIADCAAEGQKAAGVTLLLRGTPIDDRMVEWAGAPGRVR